MARNFFNCTRLLPVLGLCAAGLSLAGCSRSASQSSAQDVPADIRGEPINAPGREAATAEIGTTASAAASVLASEGSGSENIAAARSNDLVKTAAPSPAEQSNAGTAAAEEYTPLTFDSLASFTFEIPDDTSATNQVATPSKSEAQIPARIKALDQKPVALRGFMLPLRVESGLVTEMLLMRDQSMCCYGTVPKITEWVSVKMSNKGVKAVMDQPVTIFGKLKVGELRENGYLVGIYQMEGRKMAAPPDL